MGQIQSNGLFLQPTSCLLHSQMAGFYSYMNPYIISSIFFLLASVAFYILSGRLRKIFLTSVLEVSPAGFVQAVPSAYNTFLYFAHLTNAYLSFKSQLKESLFFSLSLTYHIDRVRGLSYTVNLEYYSTPLL